MQISSTHFSFREKNGKAPIFAGLFVLAFLAISGCDVAGETSSEAPANILQNGHLTYHALGDAQLTMDDQELQVRGGLPGQAGVEIATAGQNRGDFHFQLDGIPEGEVFSMSLTGADGSTLARVVHQQNASRSHPLSVDLSGLETERFALELQSDGKTLYREDDVSFSGEDPVFAAAANRVPDSFHYRVTEIGGEKVTMVEIDYENSSAQSQASSRIQGSGEPAQTKGASVTPLGSQSARSFDEVTHVVFVPQGNSQSQSVPPSVESVKFSGASSMALETTPRESDRLRTVE